jgi:phenylacetyl-CoA:acceptor oxidoreductase 27-kDa subunit
MGGSECWAMVIDLRRCIGCGACAVACAESNKITSNHWRRVIDCGCSESIERETFYLPINCMHCNEPPCLDVCPTTATYRRDDGIVGIDYEKCIGCGYCIVACPYLARVILFQNEYEVEIRTMCKSSSHAIDIPDYLGVCTKCNFCMPKIDKGLSAGLRPGVDDKATPACVVSCTSKALYFGDLQDADSEISQLIKANLTVCLQEDMSTQPRVYYIVNPKQIKS